VSRWITKDQLRDAVRRRLLGLGFQRSGNGYSPPVGLTKDQVRELHKPSRRALLFADRSFIKDRGFALLHHFADGREIAPGAIEPELIPIRAGTEEAELFRLATTMWSVPVSGGYGRRLRFLVRDRQNGKLIGVFALGDPVFNLSARDAWVGWSAADRRERLVHIMDAYVVGAVPPYAQLIGGKLVAALVTSEEVMKAYEDKYLGRTSVIANVQHSAKLVLLTTTSALGRSSLYNRLALPNGPVFTRLGVTKGFGHFHLSGHLFDLMRRFLKQRKHPYASGNRFGMGPNWKLRVARAALEAVGFPSAEVLKHGIEREVYGAPVAQNWKEILRGEEQLVNSHCLSAHDIATFCRDRWLVPRSLRDLTYLGVTRSSIQQLLVNGQPLPGLPIQGMTLMSRLRAAVGS
jgi:hypothetical protein